MSEIKAYCLATWCVFKIWSLWRLCITFLYLYLSSFVIDKITHSLYIVCLQSLFQELLFKKEIHSVKVFYYIFKSQLMHLSDTLFPLLLIIVHKFIGSFLFFVSASWSSKRKDEWARWLDEWMLCVSWMVFSLNARTVKDSFHAILGGAFIGRFREYC